VKMRRGLENGSRACLEVGPRLVEAGAQSLTLHPRSARQMYTGTADHSLTVELVERVDVPVVASGDITSRARAQAVLATTGAAAVMVGRAAQGNPWALRSRARRAPRLGLPEEVLRLVPGPGTLSQAVQARARPARLDRGHRHAPARRRAGSCRDPRVPRVRDVRGRRGDARAADLDLRRRLGTRGKQPVSPVSPLPRCRGRRLSADAGKAGIGDEGLKPCLARARHVPGT
jgi:hypothetical protein